ncbi:MAG: helix-turn-helix domain-containing protein [Chitinophagaceae bacterium]
MDAKVIPTHNYLPIATLDFVKSEIRDEIRNSIRAELLSKLKEELEEKLLSPSETCKLFQPNISKVTLHKWTREGRIQEHRIGGRVYYKYSEVMNSLQTLKKYSKS